MTSPREYYPRILLGLLVFGLLAAAFFIIKPFIAALLAAIILAYIFYPVYKFLLRFIKMPRLTAILVTIFAILLISIPFIFVLNTATQEAHFLYVRAKQRLAVENLAGLQCPPQEQSLLCRMSNWFNTFTSQEEVQKRIKELLANAITWFAAKTSTFLLGIPIAVVNLVIAVFTMFFLLLDGPVLVKRLYRALPIKLYHQKAIQNQLGDVIFATVYGSVIVALIQGALGALGFWIFGIPSPIIWGLIMAIFAFIPFVGTWLIWLPAALGLLLDGYVGGESAVVWKGIFLIMYGAFIIGGIDNLLKPKLIGDRAKVHPVLIMIGALGGLLVFGPIGFVIGPVTLALVKTAFEIYERETLSHT